MTLVEKAEKMAAAVAYAKADWPVFPLRGKTPAISKANGGNGCHDATVDIDQIRSWWTRWPTANIGTGIPDSLAVVDVDAKKGGLDTLDDFRRSHGVPETLTVRTGGGGLHLYFLHPGGKLRQGTDLLGPGLDTRMPGRGYTILPPSIHPDTGQRYEWVDETTDPSPMPRWMTDRLRPVPAMQSARRFRLSGDIDARLRGVLSVVTSDGDNWNDRLHWAACRAGEMVQEGADPARLESLLLEAAGPWNGREERGALATIRSGMNRTTA